MSGKWVWVLVLGLMGLITNFPVRAADGTGGIDIRVDWEKFLHQHDLIWKKLPGRFDHGAYLGNGLLGTMIYQDGPNRIRWDLGRSDVTEHRRDNSRLPIGAMVLMTAGKIQNGTLRLDLWNAQVTGVIQTDKGTVKFRGLIHTQEMFLAADLETTGGENGAGFEWQAAAAVDLPNAKFKDPPNPPSRLEKDGGISVCVQPRFAGGEFATAWKEQSIDNHIRRLFISIADSFPGNTAKADAVQEVKKAAGSDFKELLKTHRDWWHQYYPKSFLSIPDTRVESFYWIQMYKLACATRSDRPVMDLLGPWYRKTNWPRIWWNLNIEICYLPVYASNHLEIGESLVRFIDSKRDNFVKNARDLWKLKDGATVSHTTDYEGLRGDGVLSPPKYINPGDFTWALHNYWLHYRYSMDESMVADQKAHAFYPLLKGSVNVYQHILIKGPDGKLHLPRLHSPEYGDDSDNNYNLSLLRWACRTLIELNRRYHINDPKLPEWENVLKNLVDYPKDGNGMRIGANVPLDKSHRHWSHLLMMWPLYEMNWDQGENRELMARSVRHWLTVGGAKGINAWSRAAGSSLYASMGDGDNALVQLYKHLNDGRFVMPNAMYIEGSPVIECAFIAARSTQDMLLQSWGGTIRIFPAMPKTWKEAVIHDMRTEGAFLISAVRKGGQTQWVRVKSLAGEPCRVRPGIAGEVKALMNGKETGTKNLGHGVYEIPLGRGDEVVIIPAGKEVKGLVIEPLPAEPGKCNFYGVK